MGGPLQGAYSTYQTVGGAIGALVITSIVASLTLDPALTGTPEAAKIKYTYPPYLWMCCVIFLGMGGSLRMMKKQGDGTLKFHWNEDDKVREGGEGRTTLPKGEHCIS